MAIPWTPTGLWLSIRHGYTRLGGRVTWKEPDGPQFVLFLTRWPIIKIILAKDRGSYPYTSSIQSRDRSWHAHVPIGVRIPKNFVLSAGQSRELSQLDGDTWVFDLSGLVPTSTKDLHLRFLSLVETIQVFTQMHPEVAEELGIEVEVRFRDQAA
jgi:hypothetical protein